MTAIVDAAFLAFTVLIDNLKLSFVGNIYNQKEYKIIGGMIK